MLARLVVLGLVVQAAADPAWVKQVEAWRAKHEADYSRDYVPLAGLAFLKEGINTAGSASANQVVLPRRVPPSIGRFVSRGGQARFEPATGSAVTLNEKPVTHPVDLKTDSDAGGPD